MNRAPARLATAEPTECHVRSATPHPPRVTNSARPPSPCHEHAATTPPAGVPRPLDRVARPDRRVRLRPHRPQRLLPAVVLRAHGPAHDLSGLVHAPVRGGDGPR